MFSVFFLYQFLKKTSIDNFKVWTCFVMGTESADVLADAALDLAAVMQWQCSQNTIVPGFIWQLTCITRHANEHSLSEDQCLYYIVLSLSGRVLAWLSAWSKVQTCMWPSWFHCHSLSLASVKSRLVLPLWYWLTRVVLEKAVKHCVCITVLLIMNGTFSSRRWNLENGPLTTFM